VFPLYKWDCDKDVDSSASSYRRRVARCVQPRDASWLTRLAFKLRLTQSQETEISFVIITPTILFLTIALPFFAVYVDEPGVGRQVCSAVTGALLMLCAVFSGAAWLRWRRCPVIRNETVIYTLQQLNKECRKLNELSLPVLEPSLDAVSDAMVEFVHSRLSRSDFAEILNRTLRQAEQLVELQGNSQAAAVESRLDAVDEQIKMLSELKELESTAMKELTK